MTDLGWLALGLALVGGFAGAPGLVLVGLVGAMAEGVRSVWRRYGLRGVEYERRLGTARAVCGDEIALDITVRNRKALPLAWLRAVDLATDGLVVRERALVAAEPIGRVALANTWTLRAFEHVVRHYHLVADRRGAYSIGPVRISVGDVFARTAASEDRTSRDEYLVRPRMVAVQTSEPVRAWLGEAPARRGLLEHSLLFAGTRPYEPGDPVRGVHWRATLRTGRPQSKRYDPALQRDVLIALDIATPRSDVAAWDYDDDLVEGLYVAAASLTRRLLDDGIATGLAVAAFVGAPRRFVFIAPGTSRAQLGRIGDILARASSIPSAHFGELLSALPAVARPGTSILVLSARHPAPRLALERRLVRSGFVVRHIAFGPQAGAFAATARDAGLDSATASLEPGWRTASTLAIHG